MTSRKLFESGQLDEAVEAAIAVVKAKPAETEPRVFLAELLCFAGQWERADRQLETLFHQLPEAVLGISLFRQLIRGEMSRAECFESGRLPDFLHEPTPRMHLHLKACLAVREGRSAEAAELLGEAEAARPKLSGACDGRPFDDFRDLDDFTSSYFEVLTSTGKYYWVPLENVESLEFSKPEQARDLLWRRARMIVRDGPDGEVFLPAIYREPPQAAELPAAERDALRLGRATDWIEADGAVRGAGLRAYLVGEQDPSILELTELSFAPQAGEPAET